MILYLASNNLHKKQEMCGICYPHKILLPSDSGIAFHADETGSTFLENSLIKAQTLWKQTNKPVLADDSGICVDLLDGQPGIFSARYGGTEFPQGKADGSSFKQEEQNRMLLEAVAAAEIATAATGITALYNKCRQLHPEMPASAISARTCRYVCAMVLYLGEDRYTAVQETMEGVLVADLSHACGTGGFGYDPIVYLPAFGKTVAELSEEEKNRISHRGKAARQLFASITSILSETDKAVQ
jgi:XTP/dITP diphosphohydrolase